MDRRDATGLAAVAMWLAVLLAYRHAYIEPRVWGALCAAANPPLACAPRAALLWLQHWGVWGLSGLALGVAAFAGAPVAVAAVAAGAAGVVNYNATWGMLGAALGAWVWIRRARA
ncbi:hypothetical protein [Limobrevibacterium gyesilva]|uniref:Uncharacterized protein n=1 Tax=Limobrevibacterium gyesilva TaxID=2991712 RepID=A0AA42CF21_9PROT|nr:hypothetical protein [Limobrevibacterium gyesilva]MCW3475999.1 hypothetical protein [Limobrevibacterium gyesilva]